MKERPILMTTESVKAILGGKKTQTRRVVKAQPILKDGVWVYDHPIKTPVALWVGYINLTWTETHPPNSHLIELCPYGQIGDRLWVRETFCEHTTGGVLYRADEKPSDGVYSYHTWKPSIFMPRWASRLTLEITEVRVERLQEIENNPEDYKAEGYTPLMIGKSVIDGKPFEGSVDFAWFESLWDSLNAKRGYGWDKNPWVWVIKFGNIGERVK